MASRAAQFEAGAQAGKARRVGMAPRLVAAVAILMLVLASALGGCQMRGDVRPLSSDIVPPPVMVEVPPQCRDEKGRIAGACC